MADELLDSEGDLAAPRVADAMRGTILVSTWRWLRERGHEARYQAALPPGSRDAILAATAIDWVPMESALAHYDAIESMGLGHEATIDLGADVSRAINGVFLTTVARLAGSLGATPITPLSRASKIYARNFRGGAVAMYRVAETETRLDVRGVPMARSKVHRDTIEGSLLDGCRPFAAGTKVSEIVSMRSDTTYGFRIRW